MKNWTLSVPSRKSRCPRVSASKIPHGNARAGASERSRGAHTAVASACDRPLRPPRQSLGPLQLGKSLLGARHRDQGGALPPRDAGGLRELLVLGPELGHQIALPGRLAALPLLLEFRFALPDTQKIVLDHPFDRAESVDAVVAVVPVEIRERLVAGIEPSDDAARERRATMTQASESLIVELLAIAPPAQWQHARGELTSLLADFEALSR